ncbi:hypothetical protein Zmor_002343 [Zophobas morio]|uniref:Uncharacterized protein n=1 Tax=Zophobas morio TaxID=2755281 RepID=A0AA38MPX5_9CUCU|nr:hypothetical protein Zmor_002343 [Zophobas morio]
MPRLAGYETGDISAAPVPFAYYRTVSPPPAGSREAITGRPWFLPKKVTRYGGIFEGSHRLVDRLGFGRQASEIWGGWESPKTSNQV